MAAPPRAGLRVLVSVAIGAVVGTAIGIAVDPFIGACWGWNAAAATFLIATWQQIARLDGAGTMEYASAEDPSRNASHVTLVAAALASLVAVVFALSRASEENLSTGVAHVVAGVCMVVLSWLLVQTLYTLRYAHLYATSNETTPISFNQDAKPDYLDFAYMAFSLGMTYQVSDNNIGDSRIRRTALGHSLVAFVFGVAILATTVNVVAGLMMPSGG